MDQQFTASGAEDLESVAWSTDPSGNPATGSGETFTTQWAQYGNKTVTADCGDDCTATADVVAIEIGDLTESVTPQVMQEVYLTGESATHTIFYDGEGGELRAVRIAPVDDPQYPYQGVQDFYAELDSSLGDVTWTFIRPGFYLIKTIRTLNSVETEQFCAIWFKCAPKSPPGVTVPIGKMKRTWWPTADLVLISHGPDHNGGLVNDKAAYPNHVAINSVHDAATAINQYWANQGENPQKFSVIIGDHKLPCAVSVGAGGYSTSGKYFDLSDDTKTERDEFIAACDGKVHTLILTSCVGHDPTINKYLANHAHMNVVGATKNVTTNAYWMLIWVYSCVVDEGGAWITTSPDP